MQLPRATLTKAGWKLWQPHGQCNDRSHSTLLQSCRNVQLGSQRGARNLCPPELWLLWGHSAAEGRQGSAVVTALGTGSCPPCLGQGSCSDPVQLVFCIASHMANTINTGSNCSSQPAKVQNRESNGDTSWGWGGENNKIKHLPKIDSVIRKRKGGVEMQRASLLQ